MSYVIFVLLTVSQLEEPPTRAKVWGHYQAGEWQEAIRTSAEVLCDSDSSVDDEELLDIIVNSHRRLIRSNLGQDRLPTIAGWKKKLKRVDRKTAIELLCNWLPESRCSELFSGHAVAVAARPNHH